MDWPGKCTYCEGTGKNICYGMPNEPEECSYCDGTGECNLTANEAAKYHFSREAKNPGDNNYYVECTNEGHYQIFEIIWDPPGKFKDTRFLGKGLTFELALNAAAVRSKG